MLLLNTSLILTNKLKYQQGNRKETIRSIYRYCSVEWWGITEACLQEYW